MEIYFFGIIWSFLSRKYGFGQTIPKIGYIGYRDPNFSNELPRTYQVTYRRYTANRKHVNNVLNMLIPAQIWENLRKYAKTCEKKI